MPNSLTTVVRGFRVPMATLDRFLEANGTNGIYGYAPLYHSELDSASELFRSKVSSNSNSDDNKTRLFVPYRMGQGRSSFAYVAYDWLFVNG